MAPWRDPAVRTLNIFAAPRIILDALSAATLIERGGSGMSGSSDGSGTPSFFHSPWRVNTEEVIKLAS